MLSDRHEFYLDIALMWLVGLVFLILDGRSRAVRAEGLLPWLFWDKCAAAARPRRSIRVLAFLATFVAAPSLIIACFGRFIFDIDWFFDEDGPIENATALAFACAAILVGVAGRNSQHRRDTSPWYSGFLFALAAALILVAVEEISWGQRLLGIETPEDLSLVNDQNELNFHNIFNPYLASAYLIVASTIFAAVVVSCWRATVLRPHVTHCSRPAGLLPDGSQFFLCGLILVFSNHPHLNELVEALAAMVVLLYSTHIYARERSANVTGLSRDLGNSIAPRA